MKTTKAEETTTTTEYTLADFVVDEIEEEFEKILEETHLHNHNDKVCAVIYRCHINPNISLNVCKIKKGCTKKEDFCIL